MDSIELKREACRLIDAEGGEIEKYARSVQDEPELGFKEERTAAKTAAFFRRLGLDPEEGLAITGVKAKLKGAESGPAVAILGELDAVITPDSPRASPLTGAAHTCGHFLQLGMMMGSAVALTRLFKQAPFAGSAVFFAVPAEEYVEIEYRERLRADGKIHFLGGKQELIYRGAFEGVDMAMMVHSASDVPAAAVLTGKSSNGFLGKTVRYIGRASHAADAPEKGVNALNAAMLGLMGIHSLRETFPDSDHIRVHPIITRGGDLVNVVPSDVRLETYVRAKTMEAIESVHLKVDRALRAGGDAVGAETRIATIPGYLPLVCPEELNAMFINNAKVASPGLEAHRIEHFSGSTDMGDLSHLMPAIHPYLGGVKGALHSKDFDTVDFSIACLTGAKALAMTVIDLLSNGAALAKKVIGDNKPLLTRSRYVETMEKYFSGDKGD